MSRNGNFGGHAMGIVRLPKLGKKKATKPKNQPAIKPSKRSLEATPADKTLCCLCGTGFIPGHKPGYHNGEKAHMGCVTSTTGNRGQEAVLRMRSQGDTVG